MDDLVRGMICMMESRNDFTGPVNLGNPEEITMLELAKRIISMTRSNSNIIYKHLPEDDPKQRKPMIDLATKELGWKPMIRLEEGLEKTIEYFKSRL